MKKFRFLLVVLLFACFSFSLVAQVDDTRSYQGFKVEKGKRAGEGDILTITVLPLGNGINYFRDEKDNKPLTGAYRFVVNANRYVVGNIVKGIPGGEWEEYYYDRLYEKATYKNGRIHGKKELYKHQQADGAHYAEYTLEEGIPCHFISYHENGQVKEERFYKEGRMHGVIKSYDEQGRVVKELPYENGKLHGRRVYMDFQGKTEYADYLHGKQQGVYRMLYANGNIQEEGMYGQEHVKTGLWRKGEENGDIRLEEEYLHNKRHGIKREYYPGNILKSEEEYAAGKLNGRVVYYDEQPHTIATEGSYVEGRRDGTFRVYHQGVLWLETRYDMGSEVGRKEYAGGRLKVVTLLDETGRLVDVRRYDPVGKQVYENRNYKKHSSLKLKETSSGVVDIEF